MSTIKDIYAGITLYTEAQIAAFAKFRYENFQPGAIYFVPEFVYQDIDSEKTKYFKLIQKSVSNLRLASDLVDFTSSKIGAIVGVAIKATEGGLPALASYHALFAIDGVPFNGNVEETGIFEEYQAEGEGSEIVSGDNHQVWVNDNEGMFFGFYLTLKRTTNTGDVVADFAADYTKPAAVDIASYDTVNIGETPCYLLHAVLNIPLDPAEQTFDFIRVVAEGANTITFKRQGVNFDGQGVYNTGDEAGQFTPVTGGSSDVTNNSVTYPGGVNPTIHFKLLFWGIDNTEDFAVDYNIPAGVTLVGDPVFNDTDYVWEFDAIIDTAVITDVNFTSNFATINLQNNGVDFDGQPGNFGNPPTAGTGRLDSVDRYVSYWTNNHSFKTLQGYPVINISFNTTLNPDETKNSTFNTAYNVPAGFIVDNGDDPLGSDSFFVTGHFTPDAANKTFNFTWK